MNQTITTPHPDLIQEAEKVASLVTAARRLLGEDKLIDLSALEDKVGALCLAIQAAPREDTRELKPSIVAILEDLDRLEAELAARNADAGTGETERQRATVAYGQAKDPS
jgi:hypothetical protein